MNNLVKAEHGTVQEQADAIAKVCLIAPIVVVDPDVADFMGAITDDALPVDAAIAAMVQDEDAEQ